MRLRLLDRYVLSELLYPFIFGIASFSSIFIASSMLFKLTQYMTKYGASGETIARLFMYSLPEVVNYTFPMSMLLASLMAFGKLSGSSEIVAMKSGGISYYRIVAPVLIVAFFVSMFSVVWAEKVVPAAKVQYGRILEYEIKKNTKPRITYARRFDEEKGLMENITIEEFEKSHLARIQTAKQAYWENGSWRLEDGTVYTMNEAEGIKSTAKFKEQIIPLDVTPREISWEQKEPEEMTIRELREYISVLERQHQPTARQWCEIYMRISIPLASFFFAMIGAPLGTQKQRTSSSIGLGISIIVIFIYYAIMTLTTGLGKGGVMNPLLACIIPNLICLGAGVFLLQKKNA